MHVTKDHEANDEDDDDDTDTQTVSHGQACDAMKTVMHIWRSNQMYPEYHYINQWSSHSDCQNTKS